MTTKKGQTLHMDGTTSKGSTELKWSFQLPPILVYPYPGKLYYLFPDASKYWLGNNGLPINIQNENIYTTLNQ